MDSALFQENERTAAVTDERQIAHLGPFQTERGFDFSGIQIAYETWGQLNEARDNAILVCHALSGDAHAIGWWSRLIGPGKAIDTEKYFVICSNVLGGCQGSTGPSSLADDGQPFGSRFPIISINDMVDAQALLLDHLQIQTLHAVAGGSMGGMQALAWSVRYADRVRKCFVTASGAAHSAMQIGFNEVGRQAIMRDPKWRGGDYPLNDPPRDGLSVARMLGHITFLSEDAFGQKFARRLQGKEAFDYHFGVEFEVESYLNYQGDKFTSRFDANSLLVLTRALDYFELKDLKPASADFLFASFTSDWLYPPHQSETLHQMAKEAGLESDHVLIDLPYGHDAFLLDGEVQGTRLRKFLG